jgi:hypothetical protein
MAAAALSAVRTTEIAVADLADAGFTTAQIDRLSALREHYPFIEYVENDSQWRRLMFLKWRFEHGDLKRK